MNHSLQISYKTASKYSRNYNLPEVVCHNLKHLRSGQRNSIFVRLCLWYELENHFSFWEFKPHLFFITWFLKEKDKFYMKWECPVEFRCPTIDLQKKSVKKWSPSKLPTKCYFVAKDQIRYNNKNDKMKPMSQSSLDVHSYSIKTIWIIS